MFRLRSTAKWLVPLVVVGALFVRFKLSPITVAAHRLKEGTVLSEVMGTGTLEARVKTTISPRLQERLAEVLVDQNDAVRSGQLLARLDDGELRQQVQVAEAALAAARASVDRMRAEEARAQAVLRLARLENQRVADLWQNRVAAQADYDKSNEQLRVAEADLQRAEAAIVEAERQAAAAEQSLLLHREQLEYTQIRSPYDGLVVRRDRDAGGVVVPGSSLLQLVDTNEIWVSAWVDETAAADLSIGQPAHVVFRSDPATNYVGMLARLGRETDRETREFLVDVRVSSLPRNWTLGQRAEVYIETGRKSSALAVPERFIQWQAGVPGVWANEKDRARWRVIQTGLRGRGQVEIVKGLAAGETIVRLPEGAKRKLTEGQRIRVP
ncbi:MAG TPA: efflux RND transporter periplasmic adaptor subunit [Candidatus Paceibacterota bacterium]|nr:efflux RND transporter periplasmic adaptor subunit [Verrucomicrobiota bacterium]HRY48196.1 efflux RND transporter periplasmic adaptor subunit [Candidatus Paceibacterota bacterium]